MAGSLGFIVGFIKVAAAIGRRNCLERQYGSLFGSVEGNAYISLA
jgi:hypothetical protein